jgi:uncharacterized membrane protein
MMFVPVHVTAGVLAVVAGFVALVVLKGGTLHRRSGMIFVYAMLVMAGSGLVMAIGRAGTALNIAAATVTAYLVITSLVTVRPPSAGSQWIERGAMVAALILGPTFIVLALVNAGGRRMGFAFPLFIFGTLALSSGLGDRRMLRAGALTGAPRIRRHLWRMCTALSIAAASFFLGPARRIPEPLRGPAFRLIPLLVLVTMVYWLWRYRSKRIARGAAAVIAPEAS